MVFLKTIDVKDSVFKYIDDLKKADPLFFMNTKSLSSFHEDYQAHFIQDNAVYIYQLNDKQDVAVQISNKKEDEVRQIVNKSFDTEDLKVLKMIFEKEDYLEMKK